MKKYREKILVASLLVIFAHAKVYAQFNDSVHYHFRYGATGIYNKTNDVRSFVLSNNLLFAVRKKKIELNSNNSWIYGQQGSKPTNNDFTSLLNLDVLRNVQRIYYWALVNYTRNYSLKINHQLQAGGGLGLTIANSDAWHVVVSNGLLYETTDLEDPVLGRSKYNTIRNSLRAKIRCNIANTLILETTDFWQPSLNSSKDYIFQSVNSVSLRLKTWLLLTGALNYNRYSRTDRENLLVSFGLTAEKYF